MKLIRLFALVFTASVLGLASVSCEKKGPAAKIGDKIDDAMDARPAEGIRDAVEDVAK